MDVYRLLDSSDYGSLSYSYLIATIEVILLAILADKVSIKPLMQGRCDVRLQDGPGSPELGVSVKAGCFDALSGKKDSMANYYVISFRKPR